MYSKQCNKCEWENENSNEMNDFDEHFLCPFTIPIDFSYSTIFPLSLFSPLILARPLSHPHSLTLSNIDATFHNFIKRIVWVWNSSSHCFSIGSIPLVLWLLRTWVSETWLTSFYEGIRPRNVPIQTERECWRCVCMYVCVCAFDCCCRFHVWTEKEEAKKRRATGTTEIIYISCSCSCLCSCSFLFAIGFTFNERLGRGVGWLGLTRAPNGTCSLHARTVVKYAYMRAYNGTLPSPQNN